MTSARYRNIGPYGMVPLWLLEHPAVATNAQAIRLFAWLDARYNTTGRGRVSVKQERLATDLCLSTDTLQRATVALSEAGALQTVPRSRPGRKGGRSHLEYLLVHDRPHRAVSRPTRVTEAPPVVQQPRLLSSNVIENRTGAAFNIENRTGAAYSPSPHDPAVSAPQRSFTERDPSSNDDEGFADSKPHGCGFQSGLKTASMRGGSIRNARDPDEQITEDLDLSMCVGTSEGTGAGEEPPHTPEAVQPDLPLPPDLQPVEPPTPSSRRAALPPAWLLDQFRAQCGSAAVDLDAWCRETLAAVGEEPIAQPLLQFWRAAFNRDIVPRLGGVVIQPEAPLTRSEMADATGIRRGYGGCPHEPKCASYDACIIEIAWARRERQDAAARRRG